MRRTAISTVLLPSGPSSAAGRVIHMKQQKLPAGGLEMGGVIRALTGLVVVIVVGTAPVSPLYAALLVDTDQPTDCCRDFGRSNNNFGNAARFTLTSRYTLESVETYLRTGDPTVDYTDPSFAGGAEQMPTLVVGIFADTGANIPGAMLFSTSKSILRNFDDWFGASGFSLTLPAGTYWAGFWVPDTDDPSFMDIWTLPPSPATAYAESWTGGTGWFSSTAGSIGLRINGSRPGSAVPAPATLALFGLGLLGVCYRRRQRATG